MSTASRVIYLLQGATPVGDDEGTAPASSLPPQSSIYGWLARLSAQFHIYFSEDGLLIDVFATRVLEAEH